MRIVVTGATGFLGRHLLPVLARRYGADSITGLSSRDYDLVDPAQAREMLEDHKPDILIHLAAYSGGIGANMTYPASFFYRNIMLTVPVFQAVAEFGVEKLVYPMGGCSYPAKAVSPIDEEQMWDGYPQRESAGYSMAKKMSLVAGECYAREYGLNSVVVVPGNMYGEYDNFRTSESHVIPALVRRFYEAKRENAKEIAIWGTGKPLRDFVYAGDVAAMFPFFIDSYDSRQPVNLSSGTTTSIKDLAESIKEMVGYPGEIVWDTSKPDGQMIKIFDVARMKLLGLSCPTPLDEGLRRTISWLVKNYDNRGDSIRL